MDKINTSENVAHKPAAIVFGAGLYRDGSPTPVLRHRVEMAATLYLDGKVDVLLMSGDNRFDYYDEPSAMMAYAMELGVPEEVIFRDFAGRRTYDTCLRANQIFGIDEAILVSQRFHLARALYTCEKFDIDVVGVAADQGVFSDKLRAFWQVRETFAVWTALIDFYLRTPDVVMGDYEPIFGK